MCNTHSSIPHLISTSHKAAYLLFSLYACLDIIWLSLFDNNRLFLRSLYLLIPPTLVDTNSSTTDEELDDDDDGPPRAINFAVVGMGNY
jgi:hypothetical protein